MTIATGILNVWQHEPAAAADGYAELDADFPGRFLLGIGIGHPEAHSDYTRPLATMRAFFDGLEPCRPTAGSPPRSGRRCSTSRRERSLGAHTYFVPPEHARVARERMGSGAVIATEVACVVEPDTDTARASPASTRRAISPAATTRPTSSGSATTDDDLAGRRQRPR